MNNENNNNIENNMNDDNNFLPGFEQPVQNFSKPQFNTPQDPNINSNVMPNMDSNQFGMNQMPNMDSNQFGMNQMPNMDPNQFGMNQMPNMDPNQFGMNQMPNLEPNQFDINQAPDMEPNQFDMNQAPDMESNQFNMNQAPGMESNQFDMNQVPSMEPNQFDGSQNSNVGFNSNMNQDFDPNQYQDYSSDYAEDFTRTWMGSLYNKANSKKFNWCAALFGPAYLFYRKVYLTGGLVSLIFIIVNVILALLKLNNIAIILGVDVVFCLIYFLGLGFGFYPIYKDFVRKQLEKYKKQFADNEQLVSVASKKGGSSIGSVLIYLLIFGAISSAVSVMAFGSMLSDLTAKLPKNTVTNQTAITNELEQDPITNEEFNFADNYTISYPDSTWIVGMDNKSLIHGDYTLSYTITYKSSDLGITDMASAEGRTSVLKIIGNSVTAMATANNLQMELNENFTRENNAYYTYIDLSNDVEITRYYFILLPEDNVLFQFELKVNDTAIDYDTNKEVIEMLTNVVKDDSIDENETDNTILSNSVNELTSNNISVNETNTVDGNNDLTNSTTIPTNSVNDVDETNSINEVDPSNNTISSSLGILQDID